MYCPECFNQSLSLSPSGKGYLALNGKQSNTAIFLYNTMTQSADQIQANLETKINEILEWYSGFKNISPITRFEIYSSQFQCKNECSIKSSAKISLIGSLIDEKKFHKILKRSAESFNLTLQLGEETI